MSEPDDDLPTLLAAFELRYLEDRASGSLASCESYCARYPGYEDAIRAEFGRLRSSDARGGLDDSQAALAALAWAEAAPMQGAAIAQYRIERELGRGGQGTVYLAEDTRLHRKVALKVLQRVGSADALQRFAREALVAGRLDHPAICAVYDTGLERSVAFIAMRYVEGQSLAVRLRGGDVDLARALQIVEKAARALHVAHLAGIVHRDIKPGNVMITPAGEPVILDFGLAHAEADGSPTLTLSGDRLGTPAYMSPEQLRSGTRALDRRTDIYSLGVVLWECAVGERPFAAPTAEGLSRAILEDPLPRARRKNRAISRDLETALLTALERDPERRYQTALDFAEDLRRVRAHEPILARPVGLATRAARFVQRNPIVSSLALALFTGLVAILLWTRQKNTELQRAFDDVDHGNRELKGALAEIAGKNLEINRAFAEVQWLADAKRLDALREAVLHVPARDEKDVPQLERWLREAEPLVERRTQHEAARDTIAREPWQREALRQHFARLDEFTQPETGTLPLMRRALEYARTVRDRTIDARRADWERARSEVRANPAYAGLDLAPQLGLVPLGKDPASGLQEFALPRTGVLPARGADGRLVLANETAVVLVLLPGGTFMQGARTPDDLHPPGSPNVDPRAGEMTGPVHQVRLDPFFLAKHELTQAQYEHLLGSNPSLLPVGHHYKKVLITARHPVENVTWVTCSELCDVLGLCLPTEAQWEYAARGGTTTIWWTGDDKESVRGAANLADQSFVRAGNNWPNIERWLDDGWAPHAPIGTFTPNAFGLHDVIGNVSEWCRDASQDAAYSQDGRPGDAGSSDASGTLRRCMRGGSFLTEAFEGASATRSFLPFEDHTSAAGLRVARKVER